MGTNSVSQILGLTSSPSELLQMTSLLWVVLLEKNVQGRRVDGNKDKGNGKKWGWLVGGGEVGGQSENCLVVIRICCQEVILSSQCPSV
eukprot:c37465_g1_i1 orf=393-659(+)